MGSTKGRRVSRFVWRESTRNHHVAELDGVPVCAVVRSQKHRPDGTKHDWQVEVLNSRIFNSTFNTFCDPRDLDSMKSAAEARTRHAIESLYRSLKGRA